jgi:hypothetical protein
MFRKSNALESKSAHRSIVAVAAVITLVMAVALPATAQSADTTAIDAYLHAITQTQVTSRLAALERFASSTPASSLRVDALEWIVWDERQTGNEAAAENWARQLLSADADNALALALTTDAARRRGLPPTSYIESAKRGATNVDRLRRPEGMDHAQFTLLKQQTQGMLNAAVGFAAVERKDFAAARVSLAKAVTAAPTDSQYVYGLALADLSGNKPDRQQGYWLLAKAVNLSGGPAAARQIEEFGRKKYKEDGGSDRDWEQYLAVTSAPGTDAATMAKSAVSSGQASGKASQQPTREKTRNKTVARKTGTKKRGRNDVAGLGPGREANASKETELANSLPPISAEMRMPRTGPPVSLGILVETSMTRKETRKAIVNSLSDLVRRMGRDDETFILSFSHDLVFEEDLTGDAGRLEHALDEIKPHPGTALLDAVGFAAGHLRRIAKNDSRILLVISDGRNASSRIPTLATSGEIRGSGVKIYCIGVDVGGQDSINRLQALASGTGGTASFISAPNQFRAATQQVAGRIGIPFQF